MIRILWFGVLTVWGAGLAYLWIKHLRRRWLAFRGQPAVPEWGSTLWEESLNLAFNSLMYLFATLAVPPPD